MSLQQIDHQGLINFDKFFIDRFVNYLDEKEAGLASHVIEILSNVMDLPVLSRPQPKVSPISMSGKGRLPLTRALEIISQTMEEELLVSKDHFSINLKKAIDKISVALWDYEELLEGSAGELFQQISLLGFAKWKSELSWAIESLKEIFRQRMEALRSFICQLDLLFIKAKGGASPQTLPFKMKPRGKGNEIKVLDSKLLIELAKSQSFLIKQHQSFMEKYHGYHSLYTKSAEFLHQLDEFIAFKKMEPFSQHRFTEIYQLLRMADLNEHLKALPSSDVISNIRNNATIDQMSTIFREYAQLLDVLLFQTSRLLKINVQRQPDGLQELQEKLAFYRTELHLLRATIQKYRTILLNSDPNPYIRKRWGFTESIVGQEPASLKELQQLEYTLEKLSTLFVQLSQELTICTSTSLEEQVAHLSSLQQNIQQLLHEMAQPLLGRARAKRLTAELVNSLELCHELGQTNLAAVDFVEKTMAHALRVDWKFQALCENRSFHQLYDIHKRIVGLQGDRAHQLRLHQLKRHFHSIENFLKNGSLLSHSHDIEMEMNDVKVLLQDFLASLQRQEKEGSVNFTRTMRILLQKKFQLLEYRYCFGNFFLSLQQHGLDGQQVRYQFLFADQYFEYMEGKLADIETAKKASESQQSL